MQTAKIMREYVLHITPETHVRATQDDIKGFRIFGHLHRLGSSRTAAEEESYQERVRKYPNLYKRFLLLVRYNDYKRRLTEEAIRQGFWLRDAGMEITFYIPVSKSWRPGKKEKYHLQPHQHRPDKDNLEKALLDTLRPQQDCAIWHTYAIQKLWINEPQGAIRIICHDVPQQPEQNNPRQLKLRFRYSKQASE